MGSRESCYPNCQRRLLQQVRSSGVSFRGSRYWRVEDQSRRSKEIVEKFLIKLFKGSLEVPGRRVTDGDVDVEIVVEEKGLSD